MSLQPPGIFESATSTWRSGPHNKASHLKSTHPQAPSALPEANRHRILGNFASRRACSKNTFFVFPRGIVGRLSSTASTPTRFDYHAILMLYTACG